MQHKHSILILEDDKNLTQRWQKSLQHESFLVDVAHDSRTDLEKWEQNPYDIILLNLITSKTKGNELTWRIRNKQPWTQIIIIGEQETKQNKLEMIKQRVFDYLEKPITFKELSMVIQQALENRDLIVRSLETMMLNSFNPDQNIIIIDEEPFSIRRLFNEVRLGTEKGHIYYRSREQEILKEGLVRKSGFRINSMID